MSYEEAHPGILKVFIDVSSDTAHLKSFIGEFDENDIATLRTFLNRPDVLELGKRSGHPTNETWLQIDSLFSNLLDKGIDPCKLTCSDTSHALFHSVLENEVIRPLILLVNKNYDVCQMSCLVRGHDEARRRLKLLEKETK